MTDDIRRYSYDVVVIGAGGSGLRAAIEARLRGKKTAIISKSLFGKAHTVMAEGGCAAAMGNVNPADNWQVHFRDTMRGGKFLNNPRMAELHAQEAPDRVLGARYGRQKMYAEAMSDVAEGGGLVLGPLEEAPLNVIIFIKEIAQVYTAWGNYDEAITQFQQPSTY